MDEVSPLQLLQPVYAVALQLHDEGQSTGAIADATGVPPEAVPALLDVARAKLERRAERQSD